jgi:outer membrane protein
MIEHASMTTARDPERTCFISQLGAFVSQTYLPRSSTEKVRRLRLVTANSFIGYPASLNVLLSKISAGRTRARLSGGAQHMVRRLFWAFVSVGVIIAGTGAADADDLAPRAGSWFTQNGPIIVNFAKESSVSVNGAPTTIEANPDNSVTMSNAIGYNFTPNISAQLVLGVTPESDVNTQDGTRLGSFVYGAPSILLDYKWTHFGAVQPFVGVGGMFIFIWEEKDGALRDLKIDDTFGVILRAGTEYMINEKIGIYTSANKIFANTDASGTLGGARVDAKVDLDPWIYQFGVTYRF